MLGKYIRTAQVSPLNYRSIFVSLYSLCMYILLWFVAYMFSPHLIFLLWLTPYHWGSCLYFFTSSQVEVRASVSLLLVRFVCASMLDAHCLFTYYCVCYCPCLICYRWVNRPIFGWWRSSEQGLASGGKLLYSLKGKKQVNLLLWGLLFPHLPCFIRKGLGDPTAKTKIRNRRKSYFEGKWKIFGFLKKEGIFSFKKIKKQQYLFNIFFKIKTKGKISFSQNHT